MKTEGTMKKILCLIGWLLSIATGNAQQLMDGQVEVKNLQVVRNEGNLFVAMDVDLSALELKSSSEVILVPSVKEGEMTQELPAIRVMGRNRHYWHERNRTIFGEGEYVGREGKMDVVNYRAMIPFEKWMENAEVVMSDDLCGCAGVTLAQGLSPLLALDLGEKIFTPQFVYVQPAAEAVKTRELTGSAFIDFPVNRTEIHPDYRKNPEELQKIKNTIDVVKNDKDTRIVAITLKGYASPEGSYSNNTRLAKGRTAALRDYVKQQYAFSDDLLAMAYEPEDWDGLREYVAASTLAEKEGILELIDGDLESDPKNETIKRKYPTAYAFLLKECYPALRHSDYTVQYVIRAYTDVNEAREIFRTSPGKLSLQELYMVAGSYELGSAEFGEVFETAVRLYPDDAVANLNAANVAMNRKDFSHARTYLLKAGNSGEAEYARGMLAGLEGDYVSARAHLQKAQSMGVKDASAVLEQVEKLMK